MLSGTPSSSGTYDFTVEATDDIGTTASRQFSVAVAVPGGNIASAVVDLQVLPASPAGITVLNTAQKVVLGNQEAQAVYVGAQKVWPG